MLICLYLTKHLFEALVFIQFGGGGFDTDTLPLQIILKIRNLRRMTLPRSPALHKKQLDVQPTFGWLNISWFGWLIHQIKDT